MPCYSNDSSPSLCLSGPFQVLKYSTSRLQPTIVRLKEEGKLPDHVSRMNTVGAVSKVPPGGGKARQRDALKQ